MTESQPLVQEISAELRARQPLPPLCPTAPWSRDLSRRIAAAERVVSGFGIGGSP